MGVRPGLDQLPGDLRALERPFAEHRPEPLDVRAPVLTRGVHRPAATAQTLQEPGHPGVQEDPADDLLPPLEGAHPVLAERPTSGVPGPDQRQDCGDQLGPVLVGPGLDVGVAEGGGGPVLRVLLRRHDPDVVVAPGTVRLDLDVVTSTDEGRPVWQVDDLRDPQHPVRPRRCGEQLGHRRSADLVCLVPGHQSETSQQGGRDLLADLLLASGAAGVVRRHRELAGDQDVQQGQHQALARRRSVAIQHGQRHNVDPRP